MPNSINAQEKTPPIEDELASFVSQVEGALRQNDLSKAALLITSDAAAAWYGFAQPRLVTILERLTETLPTQGSWLHAGYRLLTSTAVDDFEDPNYLATLNAIAGRQSFMLALLRMGNFRKHGRPVEALAQCRQMQQHLGIMQTILDSRGGWALLMAVQTGTTAMLAGDFTQALTAFTQAQMHPAVPRYAFLSRDALIKSALIHVSCGNATTAEAYLTRAGRLPRTSSWFEAHIDAQRDFVRALTHSGSNDEALAKIWAISLDTIGEMWPFYILAVHRILAAGGYDNHLEYRLEIFDSMPFPRVDGIGFSGSIIPLKRAMMRLKVGDVAEAQKFLDRADPQLSYTTIIAAAAQVYSGRHHQAIQQLSRIRAKTRGFRLLELRRLAVLAAAQYQANQHAKCLETLTIAATTPAGLESSEVRLFSPETRQLATEHIPSWPQDNVGPSTFLTNIPEAIQALTSRELEILKQLAHGCTRLQAAHNLFITVNTLKTQLKTIYRKLKVSTAADAVYKARQRGLL